MSRDFSELSYKLTKEFSKDIKKMAEYILHPRIL